jgi:hypothetical protein
MSEQDSGPVSSEPVVPPGGDDVSDLVDRMDLAPGAEEVPDDSGDESLAQGGAEGEPPD